MIKKIKSLIEENRSNQLKIIALNKEIIWSHVYHDSIRGKKWLIELPLNVGRWAGNYTFFYVLNRILQDFKPKNILEFGLGESTKYVSAYIQNELTDTKHLVVEQNDQWAKAFNEKYTLSSNSEILICPIVKRDIKGFTVNTYQEVTQKVEGKFDFYLVDGPFGSPNYSRYDIVFFAERLTENDDFIILMDDTNRIGENETVATLQELFKSKDINIYSKSFEGDKKVTLLVSERYRFMISL